MKFLLVVAALVSLRSAFAGEAGAWDVEKTAALVKPSLVTVINSGREGFAQGIGTGFVISEDGLVVTNLHVVGEGRPIAVELQDGSRPAVGEIVAWSREDDLLIFRMENKGLKPLKLAVEADFVAQGSRVVAMGNPLGLRYSVVDGVVSEIREVGGQRLLQLAIPIQPGNSGGPLVDAQGRVQGVVNMKSAVTENLGYAIPVAKVHALLAKAAPVKLANWLTIGALNPRWWKPDPSETTGARWFQRAGRLLVEGAGAGFGGRALCFWQSDPPELPYEVSVDVRLDDASGAAGLAFCCEEADVHYGFYPTVGKMRLTRFQGADVSSWTILDDFVCPEYVEGEWNNLRVRLTEEEIFGYVNGKLVLTHRDTALRKGKAGVCKFRQTEPEFRSFRLGKEAGGEVPSAGLLDEITALGKRTGEGAGDAAGAVSPLLAASPKLAGELLEKEAKKLEKRALELKTLAKEVHQQSVLTQLLATMQGKPDEAIDLGKAALLIARLDNAEVEVDAYLGELDQLATAAKPRVDKETDPAAKAKALVQWLFQENGFHGSQDDYDAKANSYLNEVIDDREGLPITLSVMVIEVARRLDVPLVGLALPGHFVVQCTADGQIYDVFKGGVPLSRTEAEALTNAEEMLPEWFQPASKKVIITRMLRNLINVQLDLKSVDALPYLDAVLSLTPEAAQERFSRALVRYQAGKTAAALEDVNWLLEHQPEGISLPRLEAFRDQLEK